MERYYKIKVGDEVPFINGFYKIKRNNGSCYFVDEYIYSDDGYPVLHYENIPIDPKDLEKGLKQLDGKNYKVVLKAD